MPRPIWRGAISFGLVNVPVKLFSAVSKKTVRFNQLHDSDHRRIQMKRVCSEDGEEVPYEHIVKGYEIGPDQYVVITPEELEALNPQKTRTIDIEDFVDLDEIDPLYYEHPYYLAPDTGAAKAYKLLVTALEQSNRVAIARVVIRSKEYLTAIRAADGVLRMSTMLFSDELIPADELDELPDEDVSATDREVEMAQQLIESLSAKFEPSKYHDEYREQVLQLIERKAAGQEIAVQPAVEEAPEVPDLMSALEASLAQAKDRRTPSDDGKAAPKPRAKRSSKPAAEKTKQPTKQPAAKRAAPKRRQKQKA